MRNKRCVKHTEESRIDQLPDDLLVRILSRLTLRQAAATSVLSRRWRTLWTHTTGSLDFGASKECGEIQVLSQQMSGADRKIAIPSLVEAENSRFTRWVDRVLDRHQASSISEFKVKHEVTRSPSSPHLDKWIQIAIEKQVQNLHLDLGSYMLPLSVHHRYMLPSPHVSNFLRSPSGLSGIQSLASLSLSRVNVTSKFLEHLVLVCPLLRQINLDGIETEHLVALNVGHSSSRLKCLSIAFCPSLTSIKVSGPKFTTFSYLGETIKLKFVDTPLLSDVSMIPIYPGQTHYAFTSLSSYLTQLQSLKLGITVIKDMPEFPHIGLLKNLRHLAWDVYVMYERSLRNHLSLIEASSCLQKFTMEILRASNGLGVKKWTKNNRRCSIENHHLKVVELNGFEGRKLEMEIALYLLEAACNVKKVFIQCSSFCDVEQARQAALKLEKYLPQGSELVVL